MPFPIPLQFSILNLKLKINQGFTLVELLIVITIIAILASIGVVVYNNIQKGARDAKRKNDLHVISQALEMYKSANGTYPTVGDGYDIGATYPGGEADWLTLESLLSPYVSGGKLPVDPRNTFQGYLYYDYDVPGGGVRGNGYTLIAYPMESTDNTNCGFPWFDTNYPGRHICIRSQQ